MVNGLKVAAETPMYVVSKNAFKPNDSDRTYFSIELGYMGGSIKVSVTQEQYQSIEEGQQVADLVGNLTSKGGKLRVDVINFRMGPAPSARRAA